jgi:hypothetical protein
MDHELHAAGRVEEALEDDRLLRRQDAERGAGRGEILEELLGRRTDDADLVLEPVENPPLPAVRGLPFPPAGGRGFQFFSDLAAQARHRDRQLVAPPRRLAEPERDVRHLAFGIGDPDRAALDAQDAIGVVAELEDVAGKALDREILVDRADRLVFRFEQHLVIGVVGDRTPRGQRGEACAAPAAQPAVDRVMMQQRAAPAAPRRKPLRQHLHDRREIGPRQFAVRKGAAAERI